MNRRWSSRAAACAGLLATAAAVHGQPLELYVDDDAPPGGDGLSWATAMNSLDAALAVVRAHVESNSCCERIVRVAQGVYVPGGGLAGRDATFTVLSGTYLYGGFPGHGSINPTEGDPDRFVTVLSGDCNSDDLPGFGNRSDNVHHVVTMAAGGGHGQVSGFTIRGGHADGSGQHGMGGGVLGLVGHSHVVLCRVQDNFADVGGGIAAVSGHVHVVRSLVQSNRAQALGGGGWWSIGSVWIIDSRFFGNTAAGGGTGGAIALAGNTAFIKTCEFGGNSAEGGSGGAVAILHGAVDIVNCTFNANSAALGAAVWSASPGHAVIVNTIIASGVPGAATLLHRAGDGAFDAGYSMIEGGVAPGLLLSGGHFAVSSIINAAPRFADPLGLDGIAGTEDDDLRLRANSLAIDAGLASAEWHPEHDLSWHRDLAGLPRFVDDPGTPDRGVGWNVHLDIGAYEFQGTSCRADYNGDGAVGLADIFDYLLDWFAQRAEADFDRDRSVAVADIFAFLAAWFAGCP